MENEREEANECEEANDHEEAIEHEEGSEREEENERKYGVESERDGDTARSNGRWCGPNLSPGGRDSP